MPKRNLEGLVTSNKGNKSITVLVERRFSHPLLKKTVRRTKKYHAHDETNRYEVGDRVRIEECRPISKLKNWTVVGKLTPAGELIQGDAEAQAAAAAVSASGGDEAAQSKAAAEAESGAA